MSPFEDLPAVPDHPALEREVAEWWERDRIFERLRRQNEAGPRSSFIDGPITANNPMGIHHAWGRTLKDVFLRYKAMRGFHQRYQNGFDCQGLWVEVEVERALGLNSKREIEEYGLAEFAERCKERVARYAEVITEQSKRLGQWMDWDNDYYTFSDTNIEYIWRFLKEVHRRGWLYKGHRSTPWCPRCGTSISQHELFAGEYKEFEHPSLVVRLPLKRDADERLLVWTTTPWTLPANVAAAVNPDAEYVLLEDGAWVARAAEPDAPFVRTAKGSDLVGLEYEGPFDDLPAQHGLVHRVVPWEDVAVDEGTGIVHIAPGAGEEDFELSRRHDLAVLVPIDESGRFVAGYGELEGLSTDEATKPVAAELRRRNLLARETTIVHRYPLCWRCATPLVFRVVDDWFISAQEIRQPMLDANATATWTPAFYAKRMDDWLRNMGDWNISRKRYFGLPLPIYPCECGHVNVVGSRAELEERATRGLEQLQELHRPWIDAVAITCEECGAEVTRIPEVGDAWLDAGIVPFSTLGWQNDERIPGGYANGAATGLSGADLPDHSYWEAWYPGDWICEMREQIRLWFYSQLFMSVTLDGSASYRSVLAYEKLLDETGREMHRSWGNAIDADEALSTMGADIVRWLFSEQAPGQNIRFGYGPATDARRRLLTFWNSASFLVTYAGIERFTPRFRELETGPSGSDQQPLDRWLLARTQQLVDEATSAYERFWTPAVTRAFESFVEDVSNWYIRRSRSRFWRGDDAALRTLWYALAQSVRVVAPVMPFLAEYLWRRLVTPASDEVPASVFLAPFPVVAPDLLDRALLDDVAEVRRIVDLGRQARARAGLKLRQPLRRLVVEGAQRAQPYADEIRQELRVKEVEFGEVEGVEVRIRPNLPKLGPKLGKELGTVRAELEAGRFEQLPDGAIAVAGHRLASADVLVERSAPDGSAIAGDGALTVAVTTDLDDELRLEGRVLTVIHRINSMRRDAGLALTDRILVSLPAEDADLVEHADWIKEEVLATGIVVSPTSGIAIEKTDGG